MKKLILLSAKATEGKTAFAESLKKQLEQKGRKVCIMRYASSIKRILTEYYGWNGEKTEYWRVRLQQLGTDVIRNKMNMPNFHVNRIIEDIQIVQDDFDYIILDDSRFLNEMEIPLQMFDYKVATVRIHRNNYISPLTPEQQNHPSETSLDDYQFQYEFWIDSGLEYIDNAAKAFVEEVLGE